MIAVRRSQDRGHANHGWLDSHHTFSFANYYDPKFTGFRDLLVINEDRVAPAQGFGKHSHQDMEIISYVIEGELEHKDSLGTGSVIRPGDVQRMSAGTGVQHSEFNHSKEKPVHFLQIWISPSKKRLKPEYEEKKFLAEEKKNQLRLIVSPSGAQGSLRIHQDAKIYASLLDEGKELVSELGKNRYGWLQVVKGSLEVNEVSLFEGDGASFTSTSTGTGTGAEVLRIVAKKSAEFLFFDLP